MLVIKGNAGKSLAVVEHISKIKKNEKVLVIDREGMNLDKLFHSLDEQTGAEVHIIRVEKGDSIDDFLASLQDYLSRNLERYKHIVFYLNVIEDEVNKFKCIEMKYNLRAVLTVQTTARANHRNVEKVIV